MRPGDRVLLGEEGWQGGKMQYLYTGLFVLPWLDPQALSRHIRAAGSRGCEEGSCFAGRGN